MSRETETAARAGLVVEGVEKSFGTTQVLRGVDLAVPDGSITAVLGPSGCGKTTLLRIIAGFLAPDAGRVVLDGAVLADGRRMVAPERRRIGIVPQEGALFPHLNVRQNVAFGVPRGSDRAAQVARWLELVGLEGMQKARPAELSGGQQQRVALARALAAEPALVLLDEPFSSLDAALRAQVRGEIGRVLRQAGSTAVLVTHDQQEALSFADQVGVMLNGSLAQTAPPDELYRAPVSLAVASFVGDAVVFDGTVRGGAAHSAFGSHALVRPAHDGEVTIVVRPEQVHVDPAGVPAHVLERRYFGADSMVRLRLESGVEVTARVPGSVVTQLPDCTGVRIDGPVLAFVDR